MPASARTAFVASAVPLVCGGGGGGAPAGAPCARLPPPPVRIGYEVVGRGPVRVLLVPGMCVSRRMWDAQVAAFRARPDTYQLVLLDNRGSGESDVPAAGWLDARNANYALETLARDAWAVADDVFGPAAKVHVVGWSMGSMIAQRVALLRTARVASLALLSGHAGGWLWSNVPSLDLALAALDLTRARFALDASVAVSLRLHYTDAFLAEMVLDPASGAKVLRRDKYAARYRHGIQRDAARDKDGSVFWGHLAAVRGHNLTRDEAAALRDAPFETLVVYGTHDKVVLPCASKDLARRLGAKLCEVPAAHFVIDEASREVNNLLAALWKTSLQPRDADAPLFDSLIVRSIARWSLSPA